MIHFAKANFHSENSVAHTAYEIECEKKMIHLRGYNESVYHIGIILVDRDMDRWMNRWLERWMKR